MPITFHIPTHLCAFTGGQNPVTLYASPPTLRDAFESLWSLHPGLRDRIVDEQGEVRQHINVFVGDECTRFMGGLGTSVPDGAEISIIPAVSGG